MKCLAPLLVGLFLALPAPGFAEPAWKFWQEPSPRPEPAPKVERAAEPSREKEVRELVGAGSKPASAASLGAEIQGVTTALDYYRKQVEDRRKELDELAEKREKLRDLKYRAAMETRQSERGALLQKADRLAAEIRPLQEKEAGNEQYVQDREKTVASLEKALTALKQRQQVLYLRYFYRMLFIVGVFVAAYLFIRVGSWLMGHFGIEVSRRLGMERLLRTVVYTAATLAVIFTGLENLAQLGAFLGLLTAGLAIALKDFLSCCIGWFMLVFTGQIRVGDLVEIGTVKGRVTEISILKTTLTEIADFRETGRTVFYGNNFIFSLPLFNASLGGETLQDRIEFRVSSGVDWRRALQILREITAALPEGVSGEAEPRIDGGTVKLCVAIAAEIPLLGAARREIVERALLAFSAEGITVG